MYLWDKKPGELCVELYDRVKTQQNYLRASGIFDNAAKAMRFYYGQFYSGQSCAGLGQAGDQGELITTSVNHFRSLVRHSIDLVTQENLVFDATSENSDPSTRDNAIVAESVLNSYFYEKNFAQDIYDATELACLCGTAYLETYWEDKQKLLGADGDGEMVFVGAPKFRARSILDVTVDKLFESDWKKQNWIIVRDIENRWDLIAQEPKLRDVIEALPAAQDDAIYNTYRDEDSVWVFRAYHRECPALPLGRAVFFFEDGKVFREFKTKGNKFKNPYVDPKATSTPNGGLPVHCLRIQVRHGCHHGFTKAWDLIPMQETHNLLASTILTNQSNFALAHVAVPREANMNRAVLSGGSAIYEYDLLEGGAGVPTTLNLLATPPEVFNHMQMQVSEMETAYGVNAIMRGKIDTSIPPTGVASAIFAAQGQIMNNDIEKCYYSCVKSAAPFLLYMIARFQRYEDTVAVTGRDKMGISRKFSGSNVAGIKNIRISVGNPLAKTMAGRTAMMEVMLQYGMIKTPEQAMEVIETGNIRSQMEFVTAENKYIKDENDMMMGGEEPLGLGSDNHVKHFLMHKVISDNPQVRKDPKILEIVLKHLEFHADQIDIQAQSNPTLFTMILTDGGKVPMPIPLPETGMAPQQGAPGMPNPPASMEGDLSALISPNGQAPEEVAPGAAVSAMQSAEQAVAEQTGELSP